MLMSTLAGSVGVTLTAASHVIIVEPEWSPSDMLQAEDRVHRIGQTNSVHIMYLRARNTIDDLFFKQLDLKSDMQSKVLEGKPNTEPKMVSMVSEWLKKRN